MDERRRTKQDEVEDKGTRKFQDGEPEDIEMAGHDKRKSGRGSSRQSKPG